MEPGEFRITEQIRQRALEQFQEAMLLLPVPIKAAYVEALRRCPELIQTESRAMQFIVFAKFNCWTAAERLANYWSYRFKIFQERAFLPMNLSGSGAMEEDDIRLLKRGAFMTTCKRFYRLDSSLDYGEAYTEKSEMRRIFFVMQTAMNMHGEVHTSQTLEYNIIWFYRGLYALSNNVGSTLAQLAHTAIPFPISTIHTVTIQGINESMLLNVLQMTSQRYGINSDLIKIYQCKSTEDAAASLQAKGVKLHEIPENLGGTFRPKVDYIRILENYCGLPMTPSSLTGVLGMEEPEAAELWSSLQQELDMSDSSSRQGTGSVSTASATCSSVVTQETTPKVVARGLLALEEAMGMLSREENAFYREAQRLVPDLVEEESSPVSFLRYEKFDSIAAAKRLACYWKNRCITFQNRAFLPLTLEGAITEDVREDLNAGFVYLLPNDRLGRPVLCFEWNKCCRTPAIRRHRVMYYLESIISKNEIAAREGMTAIMCVNGEPLSSSLSFNLSRDTDRSEIIYKEAFRFPTFTFHVICPPGQSSYAKQWVLPITLGTFIREPEKRNPFQIHEDDSENELIGKFASLGISREGLPKVMGGGSGNFVVIPGHDNPDAASSISAHRIAHMMQSSPSLQSHEAALERLQQTMAEIPAPERGAYIEALQQVPTLVSKESDPIRFLQIAKFDILAAAKMLALYWKRRKELFRDRAFLPLDQTYEGALERKDVAVLQTGFLTHLPGRSDGASVLCCDGMKLQKSSQESQRRCMFYMWSVMAENEKSQSEGFHMLYLVTEPSFDRAFKECLSLVLDCIPARLQQFHFLGVPGDDASEPKMAELETKVSASVKMLHLHPDVVSQHVQVNRCELADELIGLGYTKDGLPSILAGEWGYEDFVKWQELRVRHEWELYISNREGDIAGKYLIPTSKAAAQEMAKTERKRRMTVVHSRNKRERHKMAMEELKENAMRLQDQKRRLSKENRRLASLVAQANEAVKDLT